MDNKILDYGPSHDDLEDCDCEYCWYVRTGGGSSPVDDGGFVIDAVETLVEAIPVFLNDWYSTGDKTGEPNMSNFVFWLANAAGHRS